MERFEVIRCDYHFDGDPDPLPGRLFVFLENRHLSNEIYAICLKATSKVDPYKNNPQRMKGVVLYQPGEVTCFNKSTIVEPGNLIPIPHRDLIRQNRLGKAAVIGALPDGFAALLIAAVQASVTLSPREKQRLLEILGD